MFTSAKRVTRDGRLVAYKGERMSDDEAKARGLIKEEKPKRSDSRRKTKPEPEPEPDDASEDEEE